MRYKLCNKLCTVKKMSIEDYEKRATFCAHCENGSNYNINEDDKRCIKFFENLIRQDEKLKNDYVCSREEWEISRIEHKENSNKRKEAFYYRNSCWALCETIPESEKNMRGKVRWYARNCSGA